jgi:glycosyltransferase involved in cell wall biosynthesis
VSAGDPEALAAALGKLLGESELADRLAAAAQQRARDVFGLDAMMAAYRGLYAERGVRPGS